LISHRTVLDRLAEMLCEYETVDGAQIDILVNEMSDKQQVPVLQYDQGLNAIP
jgi:ATP-dependent Zn protease